jgi:hypothetical protein
VGEYVTENAADCFSGNGKSATTLKVHANRQLSPIWLKLNAAMCQGDCKSSADS